MVGGGGGRGSGGGSKIKGRGGTQVVREVSSRGGGQTGSTSRETGSRFLSVGREEELRRSSMASRRDSLRSHEGDDSGEEGGRRRKGRFGSSVQERVRNLETGGGAGGEEAGGSDTRERNAEEVVVERNGAGGEGTEREESMVFDVRLQSELNEFDFGIKMTQVSDSVRAGVRVILERMDREDLDMEGIRNNVKEGLVTLVTAVEAVLNGITDGIMKVRNMEEEGKKDTERKLRELEEKVKTNREKEEAAVQERNRRIRMDSAKSLTEKLKVVERQVKYMDIDYGRQTNSRREIVEKTISFLKEDVEEQDKRRLESILRRTQFIILGKGTTVREVKDGDDGWMRINTVPILLEFRTVSDKLELEDMMRKVGWHPVFHWPKECLEVVREARYVVRQLGYKEESFFIKVRPDWREGRMELKAEVKETRLGGRFRTVAVWDVPPEDKRLWSREQMNPRKVFSIGMGGGGRSDGL